MFITSTYFTLSVAKEDHSDADCLVVTVLTHAVNSGILCAYDYFYDVEELWLPFRAEKCLSLAGKPKIFIIEVCESIFVILIM